MTECRNLAIFVLTDRQTNK